MQGKVKEVANIYIASELYRFAIQAKTWNYIFISCRKYQPVNYLYYSNINVLFYPPKVDEEKRLDQVS